MRHGLEFELSTVICVSKFTIQSIKYVTSGNFGKVHISEYFKSYAIVNDASIIVCGINAEKMIYTPINHPVPRCGTICSESEKNFVSTMCKNKRHNMRTTKMPNESNGSSPNVFIADKSSISYPMAINGINTLITS